MTTESTGALAGKVAVVTGSGQGLGLAYASELARQGAAVVINDVVQETADRAVEMITSAGGRAVAVVAPVGTTEAATALVEGAVSAFGRLDILVNNAGVLRDKSLLKMTDEDFDLVIQVHLRGTFTCAREAYRYFKENNVAGRIITIGSPTGQYGNFGQTNYAAAKAGIVGMVRTWALEMRKAGVTANAVIPVAATAMTETVPYFRSAVDADRRGEPMPDFFRKDLGFGTSADVAGLVAYLASDDAAGITGQVIGAGGDRLQIFSHPVPVVTEYREGGWTFEALREQFPALIEGNLQPVGEKMPPLPEELEPQAR
ncbi:MULTISPECIES: SDR family NAD(P)-dependent oxidoreductase [unclassified Arthrobacter]|uniref:SDR family NAD(P)-dependent oxidoreductase n=1 Tax=unclassified Arthrobacter TaxID=235627 RepID=UPI001D15186F|nr:MULTISPECIES: SDR family oxidoreductase [unclassified Arthrobacter]MCC3289623.1 SDR family oxidoreductase [Arthrobacter sp. zg-Y1110]MCC3300859.1 SDR family oxidoreductase [Arthrobacter sp. zg-Y895]UWX84952.1 SDR family oxidoreductase [Arthrobacter sp. zg-Y1110]